MGQMSQIKMEIKKQREFKIYKWKDNLVLNGMKREEMIGKNTYTYLLTIIGLIGFAFTSYNYLVTPSLTAIISTIAWVISLFILAYAMFSSQQKK